MTNQEAITISSETIHKIITYNTLPKETKEALKKVLSLAAQKINQDKQIIQVNHEELMNSINKEYKKRN